MKSSTNDEVGKQLVEDFGLEWEAFDQSNLSPDEVRRMFDGYFAAFPWSKVTKDSVGFDCGCGSGRWAALVAPRVRELHCIDPSAKALAVAKRNLSSFSNCRFHCAGVEDMPIADGSMDFGYSLGVLHHLPDTAGKLALCTRKLKAGAPFALYLYYSFDNRPFWFKSIWRGSDLVRRVVSRLPFRIKYWLSQIIALLVYWPLSRLHRGLERLGIDSQTVPLHSYRDKSFYTMRTDALDRFGTKIEQRFSRLEIQMMMEAAGLTDIRFSESPPFWCAAGIKK